MLTAIDTDLVQALAVRLHAEQCLPGSNPYHRYSQPHRDGHDRSALRILAGLAEDGYTLTTKEN